MYPIAEHLDLDLTISVATLAVTACLVAWAWIASRWRRGQPVPPYQPRRRVPWRGFDLAIIVLFYLAMQSAILVVGGLILEPDATNAGIGHAAGPPRNEHVVTQLMTESNGWVLILCIVSAAVVAPITEEFFFRVLLQGWLEAVEHRFRRHMPTLRRLIPLGVGPIVLTSLLFARLHFRTDTPQIHVRLLAILLAGDAVARVLTLVFAVGLLRRRVGATAADLGWAPEKIRDDIKLGLVALAAVIAPVYAMQLALRLMLPDFIAPDPLPLFFFAVVLGTLYFRTHRIMPLVVLHAGLNGLSLVLAWLGN